MELFYRDRASRGRLRLGIQFTFFDLWLCCGVRLVIWHGTRNNSIVVVTGQRVIPSATSHWHVIVLTTASATIQLKLRQEHLKLVLTFLNGAGGPENLGKFRGIGSFDYMN